MKITEIINEGDVIQFPGAKKAEPEKAGMRVLKPGEEVPAGAKKIPLHQAFGSSGMNIVYDTLPQKRFFEKPSYFDDLDNRESAQISEFELRKLEKAFDDAGTYLDYYDHTEIFPERLRYPQQDADLPRETTFVLYGPGDSKFLVDTTGARKYIRMWMKVV